MKRNRAFPPSTGVWLWLLVVASLVPASSAVARADDPVKPNIVVIYADDLGYGDVQCYNPDRGKIPTPHIDRLAAEGMRFTDAHSSSSVCSPSRYTLLTGRYHWRSRQQAGIVLRWQAPLITADRVTIATLARGQGYRTAAFGKWHLGWDWPIPPGKELLIRARNKAVFAATDDHRAAWREMFSQPIGGGPTTCGFDVYFGTDVPNWPPFCFIENDRTIGIPSEFLPQRLLTNNQASDQGPALADWTLEPILPAITERATRFIAEHAAASRPFLLYLPLTAPHTPLAVNDEWKGKSGLGPYGDFVMETDAMVGRVVEALERSGVASQTLVVFTSDNGCSPLADVPALEKLGHSPSGPLRGLKFQVWEGGHRVPFIVRWPGVVKPGGVCDQLVHQADLMATIAEAVGAAVPDDAGEDSFSLMPLLAGGREPIRETAVSCSVRGVPAVRQGSWKYIAGHGAGGPHEDDGSADQPVQLYDLAADLGETRNLAAAEPERVTRMQAILERLIHDGRSTPGPAQKNDVEVVRHPLPPTTAKHPRKG